MRFIIGLLIVIPLSFMAGNALIHYYGTLLGILISWPAAWFIGVGVRGTVDGIFNAFDS